MSQKLGFLPTVMCRRNLSKPVGLLIKNHYFSFSIIVATAEGFFAIPAVTINYPWHLQARSLCPAYTEWIEKFFARKFEFSRSAIKISEQQCNFEFERL